MRSAECRAGVDATGRTSPSPLLAAVVAVLLAGCSTLQGAKEAIVAPLAALTQGSSSTSSASPSAAGAAAPSRPEPEAPVAPAVKAAFDDASRALKSGRTADAERAFRGLVQSNPELGGPHANLGLIQRQAGKLNEAAAEFEAATQLNPKQPVYFNQLGVTYRQQGRFEQAKQAYERAIALDAGYAAPLLNLGILHDLYLGDGARALDLYTRYLALAGSDATVTKWVADLKNRKPAPIRVGMLVEKTE